MIFEAYHSKWRLVKLIMICAAFIAATTYLLGFYGNHIPSKSISLLGVLGRLFGISQETLIKSASWIGLLGSIAGLMVFSRYWFYSGPLVKVNNSGIWDVSIAKTIRWDNIEAIYICSIQGHKSIAIKLNDRSIDTPNRRGGFLNSLKNRLGTGDITINLSTTNGNYEAFMAACDYWRMPDNDRIIAYSNLYAQHKTLPGRP